MPSLAPSNSILGLRKAKHLLRRACFHYNKSILEYLATLTPAQAIEELSLEVLNPWQDPYDFNTNPQDGLIDGFWIHSGNPPTTYSYGQSRKKRNNFRLVVV